MSVHSNTGCYEYDNPSSSQHRIPRIMVIELRQDERRQHTEGKMREGSVRNPRCHYVVHPDNQKSQVKHMHAVRSQYTGIKHIVRSLDIGVKHIVQSWDIGVKRIVRSWDIGVKRIVRSWDIGVKRIVRSWDIGEKQALSKNGTIPCSQWMPHETDVVSAELR